MTNQSHEAATNSNLSISTHIVQYVADCQHSKLNPTKKSKNSSGESPAVNKRHDGGLNQADNISRRNNNK